MKLAAQLTTDWLNDPHHPLAAQTLHLQSQASVNYRASLEASLLSHPDPIEIVGLEQLFRKNPVDFQPIKEFVGALASLPAHPTLEPLSCRINLFAYSFLSGAKNFDLLLPLSPNLSPNFTSQYQTWQTTLAALESFERLGTPLPPAQVPLKHPYLALRDIFTRTSATDERRALASLLVSGPSTLTQISTDLGLNYTLGQRVLGIYTAIGITSEHPDTQKFSLNPPTIPLVVFCIRETLGLDLFSLLPAVLR